MQARTPLTQKLSKPIAPPSAGAPQVWPLLPTFALHLLLKVSPTHFVCCLCCVWQRSTLLIVIKKTYPKTRTAGIVDLSDADNFLAVVTSSWRCDESHTVEESFLGAPGTGSQGMMARKSDVSWRLVAAGKKDYLR